MTANLKETKRLATKIGEATASILDANGDGKISFQDAKYKAADQLKIAREWVSENDDFIQKPYEKAKRAIGISKWPGYAVWGWIFAWPWVLLNALLVILLLAWAFAPRPNIQPMLTGVMPAQISRMNGQISTLQQSLDVMGAQQVETRESLVHMREDLTLLRAFAKKYDRKKNPKINWQKSIFRE